MAEKLFFSRYKVTTFGESSKWTSSTRPRAISGNGTIVGGASPSSGGFNSCGFIYDGNEFRIFPVDKLDYSFVGMDSEGIAVGGGYHSCLLYTSPSPRDQRGSRMPSSA